MDGMTATVISTGFTYNVEADNGIVLRARTPHPIEIEPTGKVYVAPSEMVTDTPYSFRFLDHICIAVKRADAQIDFFYLP